MPLNAVASVLQAYSSIALLATQTDSVQEEDKVEMQVIHELLNALIQNYYKVVSAHTDKSDLGFCCCV